MTDKNSNDNTDMLKNKSFEELTGRLEEIVSLLEEGQLELEKSISLYEEGVKISKACEELLQRAEKKVEKLVSLGSDLKRVPFDTDSND